VFLRLLYQSFHRQQRRKLLAALAVTIGVAVATAMIAIAVDVGDKINRELRSYGANIVVYPEDAALDVRIGDQDIKPAAVGSYLKESDLPNIKGIFWGHNILTFAPFLETTALVDGRQVRVIGTYFDKRIRFGTEDFNTGVRRLYPWWKLDSGTWPDDDRNEVLIGSKLAEQLPRSWEQGNLLPFGRIAGVLSTGGPEDFSLVVPLHVAQKLANAPNAVGKVYLSALTKPEDAFARRDPDRMNAADRDRWYCSPYANSIAFQLREIFPHSNAEQIRQAAQNEGVLLSHISGTMLLIALASLIAAALAVSAAMATTVLERRHEVGLMKALGATRAAIASLFVAEASLLAMGAGVVGFILGSVIAQRIANNVFHSGIQIAPVLLPIVLLLALLVTIMGSAAAIRRALRLDPVLVLRGDA